MADRNITIKISADSKDAEASIRRLAKAAGEVGKGSGTTSSSYRTASLNSVEREIRKMQADQVRAEKELTRQIEKEARQQASARVREMKAASNALIRELQRIQNAEAKASQNNGSAKSSALGSFAGNLAATAISSLTSAVSSGSAAILEYSANLEQARIGFTTLIGSADGAQQHIKELQEFAKKTPFEFAGLVKSSQLLQGVGIQSQRIIPILSDVGNALSAVGKGEQEINRTVLAISQIASKGKVAGQEINQLAENGISAVTILAQATGKSRAEIIKLSEAGAISSDLFLEALNVFIKQNNLGDAMKKQSETFNGALSNIKDALYIAASTYFEPVFKKISEIAVITSKELEGADFGQAVQILAKNIAVGLGQALSAELQKEFADFDFSKVLLPQNIGADIARGMFGDNGLFGEFFFGEATKSINKSGGAQKFTADISKAIDLGGVKYQLDPITNTLKQIGDAVKGTPNLGKQLDAAKAAEDAKKLAKELDDIAKQYATQIAFFGDETTVGAAKQQLLAKGVSDFSGNTAKAIIGMAAMIDKLKEQKKATDEYNDKLKSSREEISKIKEQAQFDLRFTNPTELDKFNEQVKNGASNFIELRGEIDATREVLRKLAFERGINERNEGIQAFTKELTNSIDELNGVDISPFETTVKRLADSLELKNISGESTSSTDFAREIKTRIESFRAALDDTQSLADGIIGDPQVIQTELNKRTQVITDRFYEDFQTYLSQFKKKIKLANGDEVFANIFADVEDFGNAANFIKLFNAQLNNTAKEGTKTLQDAVAELDIEIASLNNQMNGGVESSKADAIAKKIQAGAYRDLTPAAIELLKARAEEVDSLKANIKAQEEYQQQFDNLTNSIEDKIKAFAEGGFKGLFKSILNDLKDFLIRAAAQFLASKFFGLISGKGFGGVGGQQQSGGGGLLGGLLGGLFGRGGGGVNGVSGRGGSSGGGFLNTIRNIFRPSGGGQGIGGTPNFNPNISGFVNGNDTSIRDRIVSAVTGGATRGNSLSNINGNLPTGAINANGEVVVNGSLPPRGGFLSGLQGLLPLLGVGFGSQIGGGSGAGGILGGLGGGLLGSVGAAFGSSSTALGGAFGSIGGFLGISGAATLGIGAAVGGAVLLASYFIGRNSKRKKEEKLRTQYLQDSFAGLAGFDALIKDVKALRIDPGSAITQGEQLAKTIHDQYISQANSLKDKKTRNIALKDVSRVDSLAAQKLDELRKAADFARSAGNRQNRLIPEFASGGFIDPRIYNGMIGGRFDGRDSLIARLSHGEMVLNPRQIQAAISRAGTDVFAGIVPNWKSPNPQPQTSFATGGYVAAQPQMPQNLTLELHGATFDESAEAFLRSDKGVRVQIAIDKKRKSLNEK